MLALLLFPASADPVATQLPEVVGLHDRWDAQRSWGTRLLVDTLMSSMERLAWDHPAWDPITVGDLSRRGGGPMFGHKTHDRGIDADLSLYLRGARTRDGFEDVHPDEIDPAANWAVIEALLETNNVQFILLDQGHIDRLARWLERQRGWAREEVRAVLLGRDHQTPWSTRGVVRHAPNHRSHLHVRVAPPPPPQATH